MFDCSGPVKQELEKEVNQTHERNVIRDTKRSDTFMRRWLGKNDPFLLEGSSALNRLLARISFSFVLKWHHCVSSLVYDFFL